MTQLCYYRAIKYVFLKLLHISTQRFHHQIYKNYKNEGQLKSTLFWDVTQR
jgi:hypothetical protein